MPAYSDTPTQKKIRYSEVSFVAEFHKKGGGGGGGGNLKSC